MSGSTEAKITQMRPMSATFSPVGRDRIPSRTPGVSGGTGWRWSATRTVVVQSGVGTLARWLRHTRTAATTTTTSRPTNQRFSAMASPHGVSTGTPNTSSFMKSVKSSWATWIHHSWGSLMKIQMKAASPMMPAAGQPGRVPLQPDRLVGDEEVLEGVGEDHQQPPVAEQLEGDHADEAVVPEEGRRRAGPGRRSRCGSWPGRPPPGTRCRGPCRSPGSCPGRGRCSSAGSTGRRRR